MGNKVECEEMQSRVRSRQETINKRFKQWAMMKNIYKGDIRHHASYFRVVAIVTQIAIEHGEPLFVVDYADPDFDNIYFAEDDAVDNGDEYM